MEEEDIIIYDLENWSVVGKTDDCYIPPEKIKLYLRGQVYNHPDYKDGYWIHTSHIESVENAVGVVTTASGSQYKLGKPEENYIEWCKTRGCHIPTEKEPIKLKN